MDTDCVVTRLSDPKLAGLVDYAKSKTTCQAGSFTPRFVHECRHLDTEAYYHTDKFTPRHIRTLCRHLDREAYYHTNKFTPRHIRTLQGDGGGAIQATYLEGDEIDVTFKFTAHHMGHVSLRLCDKAYVTQVR